MTDAQQTSFFCWDLGSVIYRVPTVPGDRMDDCSLTDVDGCISRTCWIAVWFAGFLTHQLANFPAK